MQKCIYSSFSNKALKPPQGCVMAHPWGEEITKSPEETKRLARKIASTLHSGEVLCLYGDLGAGKTTFIRGLIEFFIPGKRVLSPTFIIVRHYYINHPFIKNIYHVDLYRISMIEEIADLGLSEFMNKSDTIVAIEWAEKLESLLPEKRIDINFSIIDENKRGIKITER